MIFQKISLFSLVLNIEKNTNGKDEYFISETKTHKYRTIPISKDLRDLLTTICNIQKYFNIKSEYIFFDQDTNEWFHSNKLSSVMFKRCSSVHTNCKCIYGIRKSVLSKLNIQLPRHSVAAIGSHSEDVNEKFYDKSILNDAELDANLKAMCTLSSFKSFSQTLNKE